jgi:hypothetical protein
MNTGEIPPLNRLPSREHFSISRVRSRQILDELHMIRNGMVRRKPRGIRRRSDARLAN